MSTSFSMRYQDIVLSVLLFVSTGSCAQSDSANTADLVLRRNMLAIPGVGFEARIAPHATVSVEGGIGWITLINPEQVSASYPYFRLNPFLSADVRYYFDLAARTSKNRRTTHFSADYIGGVYRYQVFEYRNGLPERNSVQHVYRGVHYAGPCFGVQRCVGKSDNYYFNLMTGPCLRSDGREYNIGIMFQLSAGFAMSME